MNSKIFFALILILAGAVVFVVATKSKQEISAVLSSQAKTMGVVEVEVTPASVTTGKEVVFDVVMNNHSIDLGYDYTSIATLTDDQGNTYQPSSWTGNTSGHHVEGKFIFPSLSNKPKKLTLTINGVDNKSEAFVWQL